MKIDLSERTGELQAGLEAASHSYYATSARSIRIISHCKACVTVWRDCENRQWRSRNFRGENASHRDYTQE